MPDNTTTIQELKTIVDTFCKERDWKQFHSPKNMSMNIAIEAAELMELFVWQHEKDVWAVVEKKREAIEHEVADIAFSLFSFCEDAKIDLSEALKKKMVLNAKKYPIDSSKGKNVKYDEL